jgi:PAS domain S-box-containing protein
MKITRFARTALNNFAALFQAPPLDDAVVVRRHRQLLINLLMPICLLTLVMGFVAPHFITGRAEPAGNLVRLLAVTFAVAFVAIGLIARTRAYKLAALLTIAMTPAGVLISALTVPTLTIPLTHYFATALMCAGILLSLRTTVMLSITLTGFAAYLLSLVETDDQTALFVLLFLAASSVINILIVRFRRLIEQDRQNILANREREYRLLAESIEDVIARHTPEGVITYVSPGVIWITGYTSADVLGKNLLELVHPEDRKAMNTMHVEFLANRVPYVVRWRSIRRDGTIVWVESTVKALQDVTGRITEVYSVSRDITQRIASDTRILELERLTRSVTEALLHANSFDQAAEHTLAIMGHSLVLSRVAIYQISDDNRILSNTHEWCAPDVPSRKQAHSVLPIDTNVPSLLPYLTQHGIIETEMLDKLPADMYNLMVQTNAKGFLMLPLYVNGQMRGYVVFVHYKNKRRWRPEEIAALRAVAESYGRLMERELAQKALIAARDAALRSAQVRGQFVSNVSHEIRTPMTGLLGMLEMLIESPLNNAQREFAQTAHTSATHLLTLLNDVLDFAKIESGRLTLDAARVDLSELFAEIKNTFTFAAFRKSITLDTHIAPDTPTLIIGDITRLRQVLANLTSNAVKFTNEGSIALELACVSRTANTARLRFDITDTGIGIAADQIDHIFDSFVQADNSSTRQYGGTGLGLAICKQLVMLMGGTIEVQSTLGYGSKFSYTLTFPLADAHTAPEKPIDAAEKAASFTPEMSITEISTTEASTPGTPSLEMSVTSVTEISTTDTSTAEPLMGEASPETPVELNIKRILLAEDNMMNQHIVTWALTPLPYKLDIAQDGVQALALVSQHHYDLILMDIHMPNMDGLTAIRKIRQIEGATLPILALTASILPEEQQSCLDAGANTVIGKPFSIEQLRNTVNEWLTQGSPRAALT